MLNINTLNRLYLGVQGENKAKTISIDVSPWLEEYPNGTIYLWHIRNGEDMEYVPAYVELDAENRILTWQPSSLDTFYAGCGVCGFCLTEDEVIKKTRNVNTYVTETGSVSPGSPKNLVDYNQLENRPQILGVTLTGNKSLIDLSVFDDTLTRDDRVISAKRAAQTFVFWESTWGDLERGAADSIIEPIPSYDGSYSVRPQIQAQILETEEKKMEEDLEVQGIPMQQTSNEAGGTTLVIG